MFLYSYLSLNELNLWVEKSKLHLKLKGIITVSFWSLHSIVWKAENDEKNFHVQNIWGDICIYF